MHVAVSSGLLDGIKSIQHDSNPRPVFTDTFGKSASPATCTCSPCEESEHVPRHGMEPATVTEVTFNVRAHGANHFNGRREWRFLSEDLAVSGAKDTPR